MEVPAQPVEEILSVAAAATAGHADPPDDLSAIAVAEGQNYPPALDPQKVELGDKIPTLPAFDPSGTLEGLTFADPEYWNGHEADWSKTFGRVQKGY